MTAPAVSSRSLEVVRSGGPVLRGLTFDVAPGIVTGLLGPSGSGKTTLIRSIVGLQEITAGQAIVLGEPAGTPGLRSRVGYSPQGMSVYRDLTVLENVRYFAACRRADRGDVERVIEQVDLTAFAGRLVGQLSGGQQSRVSLAVALLGSPQLLMLDEPTVGLDPLLREQLWALFHELAAEGVSIMVSSHVMDEAERCHDLLLLRDGAVLAQNSPGELKRRTGAQSMDGAFLALVESGIDGDDRDGDDRDGGDAT